MDITPTRMGADVDITDEALPAAIELLAEVFAGNEIFVGNLLVSLADACAALRARKADGASDERIELAACEVDGIRDALVALLNPEARITIPLTSRGCLTVSETLTVAAELAEKRFRPVAHLPSQQDRRVA